MNQVPISVTPGDSELDVAYQRPQIASMERIVRPPPSLVEEKIPNTFVGFQGEVYEGGEEGFRVWRRASDGGPGRPEIEGPAPDDAAATSSSVETPTDEQMERLQEAFLPHEIVCKARAGTPTERQEANLQWLRLLQDTKVAGQLPSALVPCGKSPRTL